MGEPSDRRTKDIVCQQRRDALAAAEAAVRAQEAARNAARRDLAIAEAVCFQSERDAFPLCRAYKDLQEVVGRVGPVTTKQLLSEILRLDRLFTVGEEHVDDHTRAADITIEDIAAVDSDIARAYNDLLTREEEGLKALASADEKMSLLTGAMCQLLAAVTGQPARDIDRYVAEVLERHERDEEEQDAQLEEELERRRLR